MVVVAPGIEVVVAGIQVHVLIHGQVHPCFPHGGGFGAYGAFGIHVHHIIHRLSGDDAQLGDVVGGIGGAENAAWEVLHGNPIPSCKGSHLGMEGIEGIDFIHIAIGMVRMKAGVLVLGSPAVVNAVGQSAQKIPFSIGLIAVGMGGRVPHAHVHFGFSLFE